MGQATDLDRFLAEMGGTGEEVAATLKANGIQGVRNAARFFNPVVRYVAGRIRVDAYSLDVLRMPLGDGRKREEAVLPEPVRVFLDGFNRGKYRELELPPDGA